LGDHVANIDNFHKALGVKSMHAASPPSIHPSIHPPIHTIVLHNILFLLYAIIPALADITQDIQENQDI